jgi:hypothetical protein
MSKELHTSALTTRGGQDWMLWLGRASQFMPDLHRALQFLESSCELLDSSDEADFKSRPRRLKQLINRFVGQGPLPICAILRKNRHSHPNSRWLVAVGIEKSFGPQLAG